MSQVGTMKRWLDYCSCSADHKLLTSKIYPPHHPTPPPTAENANNKMLLPTEV